jgi:heptosyltransferase III
MTGINLNAERARILVSIGPAHGDILLATPLLASLRRTYPRARIDVLIYSGQEQILEGNTDIDDVISASKHPMLGEYLRLLRRILRKYDLAISTKETDRSIWYVFVAGRTRIGIVPAARDAWKRRVMSAWVLHDPERTHTLLQNGKLAELAGADFRPDIRLPHSSGGKRAVDELLAPTIAEGRYAVLHVNPGLPHKRWTLEGWEALGAWLTEAGLPIILTGGNAPEEFEYLQDVCRRLPRATVELAGRLRISELAELLARCTVYVGTDTVSTHIAAAAGVPTVALFGPESPRTWGPWPQGHRASVSPYRGAGEPGAGVQVVGNVTLLQSSEPCPTCRQGACLRRSERKDNCILMRTLDSERVIGAVAAAIAPPATPAAHVGAADSRSRT